MTTKFCKKCGVEYPATNEFFHLNSYRGKTTLRNDCKQCTCERVRKYYALNQEKELARCAKFREKNPDYFAQYTQNHLAEHRAIEHRRRAKKREVGGSYTTSQITDLRKAQKNRCYYCKQQLEEYHIDHVIPLSRGGSNDISNLVLACPACNLSKHDKLPHEWLKGGRLL